MLDLTTMLFALDQSAQSTQALASALGVLAGSHEERRFPDGEFKLRPVSAPDGLHALILASLNGTDSSLSPHDRLCRVLFMTATLLDHGAQRVSLVIPYLAYLRKDRRTQPLDPVSFRYLAQLIEASGAHALATLEPHNPAAFDCALRIRALAIPCHQLLLDAMLDTLQDHTASASSTQPAGNVGWTVVSPDLGGTKRAQAWCEAIAARGIESPRLALFNKRRAGGVLTASRQVWGDVENRHVLIVDDLLGSGRTLVSAASAVKQAGARRVIACVAHGFFEADTLERLLDSPIERLFMSDSTGWAPPPTAGERICRVAVQEPLVRSLLGHR
jgi:ribose-phosphate pyrophosphokinase